jgi:hypothetical protein
MVVKITNRVFDKQNNLADIFMQRKMCTETPQFAQRRPICTETPNLHRDAQFAQRRPICTETPNLHRDAQFGRLYNMLSIDKYKCLL